MLGMVEISGRIIEPLIAFSIAYVAIENLLPNPSIKRKSCPTKFQLKKEQLKLEQ
jgi:hypothetical protein